MSIRDLVPWNWGKKSVPVRRAEADPFRELQQRMNRLFDDFWGDFGDFDLAPRRSPAWGVLGDFSPSVDVKETGNEIAIKAELPGMTQDDIQVSLENGLLTLRGEKKEEKKEERDGCAYTECSYGSFCRQIPLSCEVQEDKVAATFANGVLSITLPKQPGAQAKSKKIRVAHG